MSQKTENELLFTREILCAMIDLAVLDAKRDPNKYLRKNTKNFSLQNQLDAFHFLKSEGFVEICHALGLPADKIRRKAFL